MFGHILKVMSIFLRVVLVKETESVMRELADSAFKKGRLS